MNMHLLFGFHAARVRGDLSGDGWVGGSFFFLCVWGGDGKRRREVLSANAFLRRGYFQLDKKEMKGI